MNYQTNSLLVFWCESRDLLCSHSNGDIFTCEDNMLFSHVKIPSFAQKLTWYFIGVYVIKNVMFRDVQLRFTVLLKIY